MRKFAVALALTASACSYQSPTQPAASAAATATNEPFSLTLGSSVGSGTTADHATITAKVQGPTGQPLGGVVVTFSTTVGALNPEQAATDSNGIGSTTLVASTAATVTAKAGALSARTGVGTQPAAQPPPTPTPTPAPGPNPGATPTGPLTVTLTAADVIVGSTTILNASIKDGVPPFQVTWTFGDGASFTGSSSSSAHLYAAAGTYPASVSVTDAAGRRADANATINVLAAAPAPAPAPQVPAYTITLTATPSTVVVNTTGVTLSANVNQQFGAPPATSFTWDCGNGATFTTATATQACPGPYPTIGSATAKVTATGGSVTGSGTTTVTVTLPPVPDITVNCTLQAAPPANTISCNISATLSGKAVVDTDITSVDWHWGDSTPTTTTHTNVAPPHTYSAAGIFLVVANNVVVTGTTAKGSNSTSISVH